MTVQLSPGGPLIVFGWVCDAGAYREPDYAWRCGCEDSKYHHRYYYYSWFPIVEELEYPLE